MEFDLIFTRVQGALRSVEKSSDVKLVDIDKDCEDDIKEVIKALEDVFEVKELKVHDTRRVNLFLVINTDFPTVRLIEEDKNYCHLIGTIPRLSPYLYLTICQHFKWQNFLGETILHCPEALSVDILKCIDTHMKVVELDNLVSFLKSLYDSLFQKILLLQNSDSLHKKHRFVKIFQKMLAISTKEFLDDHILSSEKRYEFMGYYIRMILGLLETSINRYKNGCPFKEEDIYNMTIDYNYEEWDCINKEFSWAAYCLNLLIAKCKKLTMVINIDMYTSWCDVDVDAENEKTLQSSIREVAFLCRESLDNLNPEDFPDLPLLVSTLNNIAMKPKSEEDEINSANLETIFYNIKNPSKTTIKWLGAFLKYQQIFSNDTYLSVIKDNYKLFNIELVQTLIQGAVQSLTQLNELDTQKVKETVTTSVKYLNPIAQLQLLAWFYEKYGCTSVLENTDFNDKVTAILNKIVDNEDIKEELYPDIIILGIQNGKGFLKRLLEDAVISRPKCDITLMILKDLKPLSSVQDDDQRIITSIMCAMLDSISNLSPVEKDHYIYLVSRLTKSSLLEGSEFLEDHVTKQFEKSLNQMSWDNILFFLDLLNPFVNGVAGPDVVKKPVVLLAFVMQVLQKCRFQPNNFSPLSGQTCEKSIQLMQNLVERMIDTKTSEDSELLWLRGLASTCSPLAWFHLRKIWQSWEHELPPDPQALLTWCLPSFGHDTLLDITPQQRSLIVTKLCKVLPLLTVSEWKMISLDTEDDQAIALLHILVDVMLILTQIPVMLKNLSALSNTLSNFLTFVKSRTVVSLNNLSSCDALSVLKLLTLVTTELPEEVVKVRSGQILSVLQDVIPHIKADPSKQSELLTCLISIKEPTLQDGITGILAS